MRRKLKNLKNKSGHTENGAPRTVIELATYYERRATRAAQFGQTRTPHFDSEYSGLSNPSRPRDQAIAVRRPFIQVEIEGNLPTAS